MPKGPRLSFNPEAGPDRTVVRGGFAPRAASLTALLIGSTALTGVALSLVGPANAGSPVWLGTVSNNWFTTGNWNPSAVPNATDTVTIDTTSPNAAVINGATAAAQQTFVGAASSGNLAIVGGGILNDAYGYIGYLQNSNGSVSVSGGSA